MPNLLQFLCLTSTISCFTHLIFKSDLACCPCAFCFRSNLRRCVVARLFCGAVSHIMSLRNFFCAAVSCVVSLQNFSAWRSYALYHCEAFLRSGLTHCVVARFFCVVLSRCLLLRDFSCVAVSGVVSLRNFFAERSYVLCRCEIFLAEQSHEVVSLRDF